MSFLPFKQETIDPAQTNRMNQVIELDENDDECQLQIRIFKKFFEFDIAEIKRKLYLSDEEEIMKVLDQLGWCSNTPGYIEQLTNNDIQRILSLANQYGHEFQSNSVYEISKCALKNIFFILHNSKESNYLAIFTKFDICSLIVHQLPIIFVPLILNLIIRYNPQLIDQIFSEIEFITRIFEKNYENRQIDIYSVIQVFSLLFQYDAISTEQAVPIIQMFNEFCWAGGDFDQNIIKFFLFDFIRNLKKGEFLQILSQTNFFSHSAKNFSTLTVQDIFMEKFDERLDFYGIGEKYLEQQGMVVNFNYESIRNFILETNLNLLKNGFIKEFVNMCFPDLFNNSCNLILSSDNYLDKLYKLSCFVEMIKYVISYSEECRTTLMYSDFQKMLLVLTTFNEKVIVLSYLSFFTPFGIEIMTDLAQKFNILAICYDILFGENFEGILAAINIFSLVLNDKDPKYQNEPLIKEFREMLVDQQIFDLLEQLSLDSENDEIRFKAHNLTEYVKSLI